MFLINVLHKCSWYNSYRKLHSDLLDNRVFTFVLPVFYRCMRSSFCKEKICEGFQLEIDGRSIVIFGSFHDHRAMVRVIFKTFKFPNDSYLIYCFWQLILNLVWTLGIRIKTGIMTCGRIKKVKSNVLFFK